MEDRTRLYLRGRFRDHYRRTTVEPPPDADRREWGYIPWSGGPGTTMVRHRALVDLGSLGDFLPRERPRHVFYSAGRYDRPGAPTMDAKRWDGADLIFDLDADHLPGVVPGEASYAEMLAQCKDALRRLLDFLETDFGFADMEIVFSGGRGYHVHVRDLPVRRLEREQRREIVDYVRGIGLNFDDLVTTETVAGMGRRTPAKKRTLDVRGGWSRRVHGYVMSFLDELLRLDDETALQRLKAYDGVGDRKAAAVLRSARENYAAIEAGNIDVHPAFVSLTRLLTHEAVAELNAQIDEPVTTDTNRLIRLPGSLHGGSGLAVTRIPREDLGEFDPLVDAIPATFRENEIVVEIEGGDDEAVTVELGGEVRRLAGGTQRVPEYVGMFLMARGLAEKGAESSLRG